MLSTVHNALSESCMFNLYQSGDVDSYFVIVFLDLAVHNFLIVYLYMAKGTSAKLWWTVLLY